jgi:hypothetical protein
MLEQYIRTNRTILLNLRSLQDFYIAVKANVGYTLLAFVPSDLRCQEPQVLSQPQPPQERSSRRNVLDLRFRDPCSARFFRVKIR